MIVKSMSWEIKEGESVVWMDAPWFGSQGWVIKWWAGALPIGPQEGEIHLDVEVPESAALEAAKRIVLAVDARRRQVAERDHAVRAIAQEIEHEHRPADTGRSTRGRRYGWRRG